MSKRLPKFATDEEMEAFLDPSRDLSEYLTLENFRPVQAEAARKDKSINLRISERLLDAVRKEAQSQGVPYQRFIRQAIVRALSTSQR